MAGFCTGNIYKVTQKDKFVEKISAKHGVEMDEVEDILFSKLHVRLFEKGHVKVENLYALMGKPGQEDISLFSLS